MPRHNIWEITTFQHKTQNPECGYSPDIRIFWISAWNYEFPWISGGYKLIEYRVLLSDLITQNRIVGWRISTGNPEFAGKLVNPPQIRISLFPGNPVDFYYPDIRIFCGNRQISALRIPCFILWFASTNPDIRNFSGNRKIYQKSGFFSDILRIISTVRIVGFLL